MKTESLIREAERLAKPVVYLVPQGEGPTVGTWWGPIAGKVQDDVHCWLALDCVATPLLDVPSGTLAVYCEEGSLEGSAVVDRDPLRPNSPGRKLYAVGARSLPPMDALFRFGSDEIGSWLSSLGWQRDEFYNDNFPDPVAREYEKVFQMQHPLYMNSAWAAVGGWHLPWPDGDWEERLADRLLVTTYYESEPWLEVWANNNNELKVLGRIT